ncbi:uncharacterized protein MICPUCDRAFT_48057 [Micromonas pusilla CCMP1545]|uniref:Predicted protein n=2 Tax=Micromonas pusilla TaxID=38833 RepID=C1MZ90_MICPC|nr:uncharacterized protein MICPUCDRAFT_48057 [Micromonas pusilla CCMP1545]EEH54567.1 predicted protein [Micromonas pusilla CCMP1545]|eukprot:XP_003060917.1 predicted protein [Micromonas pusilla CCMP1545]
MSARRNSPDALDFLANETIALAMDEARYSHEGVDGSSGGGAGAATTVNEDRALEETILRLVCYGPTIITPKTSQKHQDINLLTKLCPRTKGPAIYAPGTVSGLKEPVVLSLKSEGMRAHWGGAQPSRLDNRDTRALAAASAAGAVAVAARVRRGPPAAGRTASASSKPPKASGAAGAKRNRAAVVGDESEMVSAKKPTKPGKKTSSPGRRVGPKGTPIRKERKLKDVGGKGGGRAQAERTDRSSSESKNELTPEQLARQLLWAQYVAATSAVDVSLLDSPPPTSLVDATSRRGARKSPTDRSAAARAKTSPIEGKGRGDSADAPGTGRVSLTVQWRARTRVRSDLQPPSVKSVTVNIEPGEMCARFLSRVVQMPPGAAYNQTQLAWGSMVLPPTQVLETYKNGGWSIDVHGKKPPELTLVVPVGTLLLHPGLCKAAGWKSSVPHATAVAGTQPATKVSVDGFLDMERSSPPKGDKTPASTKGRSGRSSLEGAKKIDLGEGWYPEEVPETNRWDGQALSKRALHPGITNADTMAKIFREHGVMNDRDPCTFVDVGCGDGTFVKGSPETYKNGGWSIDVHGKKPPELTLVVPVGTLLLHPGLCKAAGWKSSVPHATAVAGTQPATKVSVDGFLDMERSSPPKGDKTPASTKGRSGRSSLEGAKKIDLGEGWYPEEVPETNRWDGQALSKRALHPGITNADTMAKIFREHGVMNDRDPCTFVDVGCGDGTFVKGLLKAFPQACMCGIECQKDLYEESLSTAGHNANFILGTAETQLAQCLSTSVIFSTTHNFDSSSVVEIVRTAARLPMVNHLVIGQAKLCTARCKSVFGPCCCFQPVGTELVNTHWGNSKLPFTIYRRIVRWVLKANEVARVSDEATVNALNAAQLDPRALMAEKGLAVDTLKSPSLPSMEPERGGGAKASGGAKAKTTTTKKNEGEKTEKIRISIKVVRV